MEPDRLTLFSVNLNGHLSSQTPLLWNVILILTIILDLKGQICFIISTWSSFLPSCPYPCMKQWVNGNVNNSGITEWMWTFENHSKRRHYNIFYLQKRPGKKIIYIYQRGQSSKIIQTFPVSLTHDVIGTKLLGLFFSVTFFSLTNIIITSDVFV